MNGPPSRLPLILFEIISTSLLIRTLSVPLVQGKVERNNTYGIRIKKAFKSKENWYAINRYGGKQMIIWSIISFVVCVPLVVLFRHKPSVLDLLVYQPLLYLAPVIQIFIFSRKLP